MLGERIIRPSEVKALAKKQAKIDDIANWEDIGSELPDTPAEVFEYFENRELIKGLEERQEELKPSLEAAVIIGGKKSLACGGFKITQTSGKSHDRVIPERVVEKLAGLGATAEQIVDIMIYVTEKGKPYTYPLVTLIPTEITE